jgi:hypothetical protein
MVSVNMDVVSSPQPGRSTMARRQRVEPVVNWARQGKVMLVWAGTESGFQGWVVLQVKKGNCGTWNSQPLTLPLAPLRLREWVQLLGQAVVAPVMVPASGLGTTVTVTVVEHETLPTKA